MLKSVSIFPAARLVRTVPFIIGSVSLIKDEFEFLNIKYNINLVNLKYIP